jgi:NADH:ubiquinone oxidoreductase subunit D/NADH:ubiquinone oxidoreductase subunit C
MSERALIDALIARFPGAIHGHGSHPDGLALTVSPGQLLHICEFLRDDEGAQYNLLVTLTRAGDDALYQVVSLSHASRLRLRVPLPQDRRTGLESVSFVWPAANWAEREARDLWGITFSGHPDPEPLLHLARPERASQSAERTLQVPTATRYPTSVDGLSITLELDEAQRVNDIGLRLGNRHSAIEARLAEWPVARAPLLAARLDGFAAMSVDLAYALAAERLLGIEIPPRAQTLRVIYAELQRVASHLFWLARCAQNLGDPPLAAPAYAWQGRTAILDLFQWLGGNPITPDLITIGGLGCDAPASLAQETHVLVRSLQTLLQDLDRLLTHSPGFREQLRGVGVIDPGTALGLGVTGPCLRACGIDYDVRKTFPYAAYARLEVEVPVVHGNDADARYRARIAEMRSSLQLIVRAVARLENGPVNAYSPDPGSLELPEGTGYAAVEGPRGELGILMCADGGTRPQRVHVRGPSFANLSALPFMVRGAPRYQVAIALHSLDVSMGEVER